MRFVAVVTLVAVVALVALVALVSPCELVHNKLESIGVMSLYFAMVT
jgi:hypothetical protein